MDNTLINQAIQSVLNSQMAFCKFLSANDTGLTGAHQVGILVSISAREPLFTERLENENILKRFVKIRWQNDLVTESAFTYYSSKGELRITRFGRDFPFLKPDQTGALFVFTKQSIDDYSGYFLETDEEINEFLNTFNLSPVDTNRIIDTKEISVEAKEKSVIQEYIESFNEDFPASEIMSLSARSIYNKVYGNEKDIMRNPDKIILDWTNVEYTLFRSLEYARYMGIVSKGFESVEDFISMANMVLNRRKSRAGKSLEHHLAAIFDGNGIHYTAQAITEERKRPDFIFPSEKAYHNVDFSADKLISLAAKTTCKDRWRQIINEADRLRDRPKYLCTLQQGISPAQMDEMQAENVILVVPKLYITSYPKDRQDRIWTVKKFVSYVKEIENV